MLLRLAPGAEFDEVLERHPVEGMEAIPPFKPPRVRNIEEVGSAPVLLAGFLAVLALAGVAHALVLSIRLRRPELAVLRSMGMVARQVRVAFASQATSTVVVGCLIGLPLGIVAGRWAWIRVADGVGVLDRPLVPPVGVVLIPLVALVLGNTVAVLLSRRAARLRPAEVLRAE